MTVKDRVAAHRARQSALGLVRVEVKIPVEFKSELLEFVKKLNEKKCN